MNFHIYVKIHSYTEIDLQADVILKPSHWVIPGEYRYIFSWQIDSGECWKVFISDKGRSVETKVILSLIREAMDDLGYL